jgi:mono/diheme cytochrome c family protein
VIAVAVGLVIVLVLALVIAVFGSGSSSGPPKTVGTFNTELQFDIRCGSCHRPGGPGPHLSQAVLTKAFPNIEDQIKFVENGKDGMPAFKGNLTSDQLRQIVEYTRTLP